MHLNENLGLFRVNSSRQVHRCCIDDARLELLGVLRHCDGMQVHHKEKILVLVLAYEGSGRSTELRSEKIAFG